MTEPVSAALPQTKSQPAVGGPWLTEARALIALAAPLVLTQLAQMAIMTTDIVMLGRLDKTALASAAIGNTLYYLAWLIGCGPAAAVAPMIAHIAGERGLDRAKVRRSVRMGLWATAITCVPMALMLLEARPILIFLHQDPHLAAGLNVSGGKIRYAAVAEALGL